VGATTKPPYPAAFRAEAVRLARTLAERKLAAVVSSPMQRARETAAIVAAPHGLEVLEVAGLNEIDFGDWTGMTFEALHDAPGWAAFNTFRSTAPIPGGETMLAAQARAVATVAVLAARFPEAEVAAVSHGDIVKAVVAHALGVPLDLFHRIEIEPASRSVIALGPGATRVLGVNHGYEGR
jgi:broad specificity phosphatase PhoE